jgi:hypothetical protein
MPKRKIKDTDDASAASHGTVMAQGSIQTFLDKIAKLRTDTKQQAAEMKKETNHGIRSIQSGK